MASAEAIQTPVVHVVRAEGGKYAHAFKQGGYAGIGWFEDQDLTSYMAMDGKEQLRLAYEKHYPEDSNLKTGQNVGQIWRFLTAITPGSYVITPTSESNKLMVGQVTGDYHFVSDPIDSRFPHRKSVKWFSEPLLRNILAVPTQHTLGSIMAVFRVKQAEEILVAYNVAIPNRVKKTAITQEEVEKLILAQILELTPDEFEILFTELLTAIGFEASHVGKTGDGGIDVTGTLRVYDFASMDLTVQVKRYASSKIDPKAIKHFRSSVPEKSQAAFVTTSDFNSKAREEAEKRGFKKIGLINGKQLVGILVEHYEDLTPELKEKLNLRRTLIPN